MKKKIVFVGADDWAGMFIDGKLVAEGHSVESDTALTALGIEFEEKWADDEWLETLGRFPQDLKDVKFERTK